MDNPTLEALRALKDASSKVTTLRRGAYAYPAELAGIAASLLVKHGGTIIEALAAYDPANVGARTAPEADSGGCMGDTGKFKGWAEPTRAVVSEDAADIYEAYKSWPADIRRKLSFHDLRRMNGWRPRGAVSVDGWEIDTSTGTEILVYGKCSVIEDEQARYVLSLIHADAGIEAPAPQAAALVSDAWKAAVIDQCVIHFIDWNEADPRATLKSLIFTSNGMALDPQISEEAQALIDQGAAQVTAGQLIMAYREWIATIPVGQSDEQRGSSAYNWHTNAAWKLTELTAALRPDASTGEG